ncbi:aldehyde ferredoxin oxidoreductase family protein [Acidaminobacter sp. JC074]|uniref:aldehyde ferredoxin oxidoreductase family protein n=1 Tax=Acidaminobacter sp. JC074 TaxID=2530199 RepID=UPI001F111B89|nr:aldehyde ferredoxin oxidoreductase C-terminal domain-containing protein [Acidaminobacter sp. JC074]
MNGFMGKVLHIDLTLKKSWEEEISDDVYRKYLSGMGLGTYMLYRELPPDCDPLGEENLLCFLSGVLTGTASFMTGRWMVMSKSPLTGGIGHGNCGGTFSPAIKQCGYDGIFIRGKSKKPVYLYINNNKVEIKDAGHLWGVDTVEAEILLKDECKKKKLPEVALIGKAGENQSYISGIVNDGGRIAARSGMGAVMGSKMLKAIVLEGNKHVNYDNPDGMKAYSKKLAEKVKSSNLPSFINDRVVRTMGRVRKMNFKHTSASDSSSSTIGLMKAKGTVAVTEISAMTGDMPIHNWKENPDVFPVRKSKKVSMDKVLGKEFKKYKCVQCPIGCGGVLSLEDNTFSGGKYQHTHKPEYETMAAFTGMVGNYNLDALLYFNEFMNRTGMNTISAGSTVAFAIECYTKGILTKEDTCGLDLTWGNADACLELLEQMVERSTPLGDMLADGVRLGAQRIGKGSEAYAIHAGGQEPAMHDPRIKPGLIIDYCASPTPGKHTNGNENYELLFLWERVSWAPSFQRHLSVEDYQPRNDEFALQALAGSTFNALLDCSGGCLMAANLGVDTWDLFEMLELATGYGLSPDEYMEIGLRVNTTRQLFNIKHGIKPINNLMHKRLEQAKTIGPMEGKTFSSEPIVSLYWEKAGYDPKNGYPKKETIEALEINRIFKMEVQ